MSSSAESSSPPQSSSRSESNSAPASRSYDPTEQIAQELGLSQPSVRAVAALSAEGATVPFIARYRKEATGGLDEVQIRAVFDRRAYLLELDARRKSVLVEIDKQGKLDDSLKKKITSCQTKAELEDLYLPYKPKRRTRAMIAIERGLQPLAELIWEQPPKGDPSAKAAEFVSAEREVANASAALAGARDIVAERLAEQAELRRQARKTYLEEGSLEVVKTQAYKEQVTKFDNYAQFAEPLANIASHRYLAVRRGESEGVLRGRLCIDEDRFVAEVEKASPLHRVGAQGSAPRSPWASQLEQACREATTRQLLPSAQVDVRVELKMRADRQAVEIFAKNLRELLMAAPLGERCVLGIDPGQRTGCKCVVVDSTGKLLAHDTVYLVQGDKKLQEAEQKLRALVSQYEVQAVAVGNGTHGRETEAFVRKLLAEKTNPGADRQPFCVSVSESGASVYSASETARDEFPDLDLTVRGAISIARRLQDPLAELVKLDPKSIGVGQYQHDVYQSFLSKKLEEVVESCVHDVGVELNTASAQLLSRVSGLGPSLAKKIVEYRNSSGSFRSREQLLTVPGLGPRSFEQAAGFLRIRGADNPLDASAVHPERYALVEQMARDLGVRVHELVGSRDLLRRLDRDSYQQGDVGRFTVDDIVAELLKPGRDPREEFEPPKFRSDVNRLEDLTPGMRLEGVVTNVTAFGAFVDVGVHQDGLVHVSKLADRYVKDPSEVVKVGDKIQVYVLEVDLERKRVGLSVVAPDAKRGEGRAAGGRGAAPSGRKSSSDARGGSGKRAAGRDQRDGPQRMPVGQLTHNPFAAIKGR